MEISKAKGAFAAQEQGLQIVNINSLWLLYTHVICTNQLNPCLKKLGGSYLNVLPPVSQAPHLRIFILFLCSLGCQREF